MMSSMMMNHVGTSAKHITKHSRSAVCIMSPTLHDQGEDTVIGRDLGTRVDIPWGCPGARVVRLKHASLADPRSCGQADKNSKEADVHRSWCRKECRVKKIGG